MPDRDMPPRWRALLRLARAALYLCVIGAGIGGLIWQPTTIAGTIGEPLTVWWTLLAATGGAIAFVSIIADKWQIEALATWGAVGGLVGYAVAVWSIVADDSLTRIAQACVVTGLAVAVAEQGIRLGAHAAKLRVLTHRKTRR